jgi:CRP/FNR family transcriptional regulator
VSSRVDPGVIGGDAGGFLNSLPADLRAALGRDGRVVRYPAGSRIAGRGTRAEPGVVRSGLARIYVTAADGREATVQYLRPGDAIGLARIFVELPGSLQAVQATTVLHFDLAQFVEAMSTEAAVATAAALQLARLLRGSEAAFERFVFGRVRQRVAEHLLSLATADDHGRLVAKVTQRTLADAVGSVRDVVARALRELRAEGLVVTAHGGVLLTDPDRLGRVARGR